MLTNLHARQMLNLSTIMSIVVTNLKLDLLANYHRTLQQIHLDANRETIGQIRFLYWMCVLKCGQMMALFILPLGHWMRSVQFDYIQLQGLQNSYNALFGSLFCLTFYFLEQMYLNPNCMAFSGITYQTLVLGQSGYFLRSAFSDNRQICDVLRQVVRYYLQFCRLFVFGAGYWILILEATFVLQFNKIQPECQRSLVSLLVTQVKIVGDALAIQCFAHICIQMSVNYIAFTLIFFIRINQINRLLLTPNRKRGRKGLGSFYAFSRFSYHHTTSVLTLFQVNRVICRLSIVFLSIHTPMNAYLLMSIFLGLFPLKLLGLLIAIFAGQIFSIFGFHLLATEFASKIHKHSKSLIHLFVCGHTGQPSGYVQSWRARLKLSNYIQKFHTTKRYGVTYGTVANISLDSFSKVGFTQNLAYLTLAFLAECPILFTVNHFQL